MVQIQGRMEQDVWRFHHATLNDTWLKTYILFISEIFKFNIVSSILDCNLPGIGS